MKQKHRFSINDMVLTGMFAAVLAVIAQLSIPMPSGVPATIQMFGVALCGVVLGWKAGGISMLIYLLIGAMGAPVFANFGGGLGTLFGKTGGFLIGYPFMAVLCGLSEKVKPFYAKLLLCFSGLLVCHLFGTLQYMLLTGMRFPAAALLMSLPYLLKDALLVSAATALGRVFRTALRSAGIPLSHS